jgi:hypothetical protein
MRRSLPHRSVTHPGLSCPAFSPRPWGTQPAARPAMALPRAYWTCRTAGACRAVAGCRAIGFPSCRPWPSWRPWDRPKDCCWLVHGGGRMGGHLPFSGRVPAGDKNGSRPMIRRDGAPPGGYPHCRHRAGHSRSRRTKGRRIGSIRRCPAPMGSLRRSVPAPNIPRPHGWKSPPMTRAASIGQGAPCPR